MLLLIYIVNLFLYFRMWTLIHLYEPPNGISPDLIPNVWIIDSKTCWYPMSFRLSKIKSLARDKSKPNKNEWEKFKIKIVESNIGIYYNT